jgi:hypothetical protein
LLELSSLHRPRLLPRYGVSAHNTSCVVRPPPISSLLPAVGHYCRPDFGLCEVVRKRCCDAILKLLTSGSMHVVSAISGVSTCSTFELLSYLLSWIWPANSPSASSYKLGPFIQRFSEFETMLGSPPWPYQRRNKQQPWFLRPARRLKIINWSSHPALSSSKT